MNSTEIRSRFLKFFEKRGHAILESASLVTSDEKGITNPTLFNTAGMQPLIPYLLGKPHPKGTRLVDVQKCLRTVDIDDVGDRTHATFFEMLGNWSLGDYFKKEAINWSYEFLTSKEEGLGLDPSRLYVTVFEGDSNAERDEEAADIWKNIFKKNNIEGNRVFYMPASMNWWEAGENGPCGPDTEMYYDISGKFSGQGLTHEEFLKADEARDVVEVWNDVFMQYEKKDGKIVGKLLPKPSVDTGAGLERLAMTMQGVDNIFDTDLLRPVMDLMAKANNPLRNKRIIADHLRASVFLIADGVVPSNTDRGYVLRKLIRRAIMSTTDRKLDEKRISAFVDALISVYEKIYPDVVSKKENIKKVLNEESAKFGETLKQSEGERIKFNKIIEDFVSKEIINAKFNENIGARTINIPELSAKLFELVTSRGLPVEFIFDGINENMRKIRPEFDIRKRDFGQRLLSQLEIKLKKHQELSRVGAEQKFKGGLADTSEKSLQYHTATHLLHKALREVLGDHVEQKGSNITPERLRFDFSHSQKMTDEEKKKVEDIVNQKIQESLPVNRIVLPKEEALQTGALHFFGEKYGDEVSIYYVGDSLETAFSKEFCGGPHVKNTNELNGRFKIQKEEAVSQGVRRIKAVLE